MNPETKWRVAETSSLLLTAVMMVFAALVLWHGVNIQRSDRDTAQKGYTAAMTVRYVSTKVRQAPYGVAVKELDGRSCLVIRESGYATRLYWYDGWLREISSYEGDSISASDGIPVIRTDTVSFSGDSGLLEMTVDDKNGTRLFLDMGGTR